MKIFTAADVILLDDAIIAYGAAAEEWDVTITEVTRSTKELAALENLRDRIKKESGECITKDT